MFEKEVTDLCCSTCNAEVSCREKCECWTFAKKGMEFGYNKAKDENTELKEQIEKMKCCENCRYYSRTYEHCYSYESQRSCTSLSNWRLAE